jgi:hypothetical protein
MTLRVSFETVGSTKDTLRSPRSLGRFAATSDIQRGL